LTRRILQQPAARFALLFLLLLAARVPFYFTHHIQEDAYISLRCAENLAQSGVYGFNPGERVSASTSHLYVFLAALVRLAAGDRAFIPILQLLNGLLFLLGTWFTSRALFTDERQVLWLWGLLSILPQSLLASYSGMETSLLVFIIGWLLYQVSRGRDHWLMMAALAILPWVRPDAIAYALLILFWDCVKRKRVLWAGLTAVVIGVSSLLIFNSLYFGTLLQQSINAKLLMRHPFTISRFADNLFTVFVGNAGGAFSPYRAEIFGRAGILFGLLVLLAMGLYLGRVWSDRAPRITGLALASITWLVPVAYAFGGVLYQWYTWPPAIFGSVFLLALIVEWSTGTGKWRWAVRLGSVLLMLAGIGAQMVFSYVWGTKEFAYRGGIGVWLKEHAQAGDKMLLEPAGYIPYYSGLYTYDEVGLVSPQVVNYRLAYEERWWPEFVMDYRPDWLVQREHIKHDKTYQGYTLNGEELEWLRDNYRLVAWFSYQPEDYTSSHFLASLLSLAEADDYYIFKRIE